MIKSESNVLQYFGNMRYNSAAPDAFSEVMKVGLGFIAYEKCAQFKKYARF